MIGTVLGNYRITQKIGEGGMGAVFKGIDMMLERDVAIKMLRPELASQPDVVERFRSEAVTLAKLNHPNIATLYSFLRQGSDFFMVMEFVQGETLDCIIRRSGALPVQRAVTLFCQALEGIGRAHKLGIIHRDIKPANMMLTTEEGSIKVMDFGIARVLGTARMTRQGNIVGTIEYMSPEAIQGLDVDARTDIYSLGVLLYEMLTGRLPFTADTEFGMMMAQIEQAPPPPTTIAPHVPLGIERAIMRSLAKRAEARFQTAGEFREALQAGLSSSFAETQALPLVSPPATRIASPAPATPVRSDPVKGTRLAGPATPSYPISGPAKETRLAQQAQPQYPQQQAQQWPAQHWPAQPEPRRHQSFFSKLTWIHYSAAAAFLAGLIAVPVILISTSKKEEPQKPPPATVSQPSSLTTQPAPSGPAVLPGATPATQSPPPGQSPGQSPGLVETEISTTSPNAGAQPRSKAAKPTKKKEDDDLARRRREARKILDQ